MIERYTTPEMGKIWSEESKFRKWLEVEIAVAEIQAELGIIPKKALDPIKEKAAFSTERIEEIEKNVRHDVIAFLTNVSESIGEEAKWLHYGLTSYDVVDTSLAMLMREAGEVVEGSLAELSDSLKKKAIEHKRTPVVGRTHGVHAEPTSLGLKFLLWYAENERNRERLRRTVDGVSYGKLSGSVGNFAHLDPEVEEAVCKKLGLKAAPITTQIIQRDRHADFLSVLAIIASSLEKFASEIRHLHRTEIGEVKEPFLTRQKGSSSMPHKRNPIICERICGLARVVRSNCLSAFENIPLWNERDISNSSVERVVIPDSTTLVHYIVRKFIPVVERLSISPKKMEQNLGLTRGLIFSQRVLLALIEKGMDREEAYEVVQRASRRTLDGEGDFRELLGSEEGVGKKLTPEELDDCFKISYYLRNVDKIYDRVLK